MPVHVIRLLAPAASCEADEGQTLLEAAQAAGITLQSSCRNGTCRTCLCRLEAGTVEYRVPWPGVTPEERAAGWVLPCVAEPRSDIVLGAPAQHGWWSG